MPSTFRDFILQYNATPIARMEGRMPDLDPLKAMLQDRTYCASYSQVRRKAITYGLHADTVDISLPYLHRAWGKSMGPLTFAEMLGDLDIFTAGPHEHLATLLCDDVGNSNVDHMDDVFDTWPADGPTLEEHIASLEVTDDPRGAFVAGAKLIIKRGAFPTPNAIKALTRKLHQRTAIRHWRAS